MNTSDPSIPQIPQNIPNDFQNIFTHVIPPHIWHLYEQFPDNYWELLERRDGSSIIVEDLKNRYSLNDNALKLDVHNIWQGISLFYRYFQNQYYQAIEVMSALYEQMILYQIKHKKWIHKAMPLVWMRDFHILLDHNVLAKRYAMLTLCDDSIRDLGRAGTLSKEKGGIYFRLLFYHGMSDKEITKYAKGIYDLHKNNPKESLYPEWILQQLDNDWMIEYPTLSESNTYISNPYYMKYLLNLIRDDSDGRTLELLADYILSIVPGFRTHRRQKTKSTEYDIFCTVEGISLDFRVEMGRYFLCECKNWNKPADFTVIAKFCNVLESAKCKSGIIFSKKGISGEGKEKNAERELLKAFQRNGLTVIVIDHSDLKQISDGYNLITMLRSKYEKIRFDLL